MNEVLISLGSNLGDRIFNIKKGLTLLEKRGLRIRKVSGFFVSSPMYFENQPYFINAAASLYSPFDSRNTLKIFLETEKRLKRVRNVPKGPRTLDIDMVYFNGDIINSDILTVPHPGRLERSFVLLPLAQIAGNFIDPVKQKSVSSLVFKLKNDLIEIPEKAGQIQSFLDSLAPKKIGSYGLKEIEAALKSLGEPHRKIGRIVHIAGSAGKSSTASFCAQRAAGLYGKKTGLYISPHICSFRERISINGKKISEKDFLALLREIISNSPVRLSYFEFLTAAAFLYFSRKKVDLSVIEAGLGGAKDATNCVRGDVCVFTPVTKEHADIIGPELKDIALEKSGIIKNGSIVLCSKSNAGKTADIFKRRAEKKKARRFELSGTEGSASSENKAMAERALFLLYGEPQRKEKKSYKKLPARYESFCFKNKKILLDGAHTPLSFKKLFEMYGRFDAALISFSKDKDIRGCLKLIEDNCGEIIVTQGSSYRAVTAESLYEKVSEKNRAIVEKDFRKAFRKAVSCGKKVLVCGSLYFCGDIKGLIENKKINHPREMPSFT